MRTLRTQDGFTLVELLLATAITLIVLATATGTFSNALMLNDTATLVADSNQSLRAGTNTLVRDLMQAGRGITIGGIPIPSGAGATALVRPAPLSIVPVPLFFDNATQLTLNAVTTGFQLGPRVNNSSTDMVTLLALDPTSYVTFGGGAPDQLPLIPNPAPINPLPLPTGITAPTPRLADDGTTLTVGQFSAWLSDPISGIKVGDILLFNNTNGSAIQTVTGVTGTTVAFAAGDPFNFNQRGAARGSIMQIRGTATNPPTFPLTNVVRIQMLTYYLDDVTTPGEARLVRQINFFTPPQALAGVVDNLIITYDLVEGTANTSAVPSLPALIGPTLFTASQIRKANLRVAVRSETRLSGQADYLRNTTTTVVSLRNLAYKDRYK
jgi:prepilin-type N-terminal cleavage/methylation domain-containing protein